MNKIDSIVSEEKVIQILKKDNFLETVHKQDNDINEILIASDFKPIVKRIFSTRTIKEEKTDLIFGMWADKQENVDTIIRDMRE